MSSNVENEQLTPTLEEVVYKLNFYVPLISLFGATLVFLVVLISRLLKLPSSKRLSFKISLWVALSDIIYVLSLIFPYFLEGYGVEVMNYILELSAVKALNIILPVFGTLWYVFLTSAMSANLYYTFVRVRPNFSNKFTEFSIVFTTLLLTLIIVLPPTIACIIYNKRSLIYFTEDKSVRVLLTWLQVDLWISLSIIYNSIVVFHVVSMLMKHRRTVTNLNNQSEDPIVVNTYGNYANNQNVAIALTSSISDITSSSKVTSSQVITNSLQLRRRLNLVAIRVTGYVLVPVITLPLFVIISSYLSYSDERNNFVLALFYDLFPNLIGLLNAIVFCFDPALPDIYSQLKFKLYKTNNNSDWSINLGSDCSQSDHSQSKHSSVTNLTCMEMSM